ncbi:MAG: hypothetical protein LBL47_04480 [Lactobacillus sp.]|jgi:hypothetical protein|nr:hypothetical protein [Lactobacillus sp.]
MSNERERKALIEEINYLSNQEKQNFYFLVSAYCKASQGVFVFEDLEFKNHLPYLTRKEIDTLRSEIILKIFAIKEDVKIILNRLAVNYYISADITVLEDIINNLEKLESKRMFSCTTIDERRQCDADIDYWDDIKIKLKRSYQNR